MVPSALERSKLSNHCHQMVADLLNSEHPQYVEAKVHNGGAHVQILRVQVNGVWVKVADALNLLKGADELTLTDLRA